VTYEGHFLVSGVPMCASCEVGSRLPRCWMCGGPHRGQRRYPPPDSNPHTEWPWTYPGKVA
jgi:hypothetical protein